jgi:hypothetical protein
VHFGRAENVLDKRQAVLQAAYKAHPERFVKGAPVRPTLPDAVWINPPKPEQDEPMRTELPAAVESVPA